MAYFNDIQRHKLALVLTPPLPITEDDWKLACVFWNPAPHHNNRFTLYQGKSTGQTGLWLIDYDGSIVFSHRVRQLNAKNKNLSCPVKQPRWAWDGEFTVNSLLTCKKWNGPFTSEGLPLINQVKLHWKAPSAWTNPSLIPSFITASRYLKHYKYCHKNL